MRMKSDQETRAQRQHKEVAGIVFLLHSARAAAQRYCDDQVCESILESCAVRLKATFAFSDSDCSGDIRLTPPSFAALLRMLEYLRVEISTVLKDQTLSNELAKCAAHLAASRQLSLETIWMGSEGNGTVTRQ